MTPIVFSAADWPADRWPNFSWNEIRCKHTGVCRIHPGAMDALQALRRDYGRPMRLSSAYRDPRHPIEAKKAVPGRHAQGVAFDILCHSEDAYDLLALLREHGVGGIGVWQKGPFEGRYIHVDWRTGPIKVWSY